MREESFRAGIYAGDMDGTRFTAYDVADVLELEEIVLLSKDNTEVVGVFRDAFMGIVYRGYTIARLVPLLAFDTSWGPVIITFLLKVGWRMQIKYDNCMSIFSRAKRELLCFRGDSQACPSSS